MLPRTEWLLPASLTHARQLHAPIAGSNSAAPLGMGSGLRVEGQGSPNESADPGVSHTPQVALLQCWKQKIDELCNVLLLLLIFLSAAVRCLLEANRPLWPQSNIYSILQLGCWRQKMCPCSPSDKQTSECTSGKGHIWQRFSITAWKHGLPSTSYSCEDHSFCTFKSLQKAGDRQQPCLNNVTDCLFKN